ncbi:snRNA-activating protein complex subunit-like isoform X1 [Salvia divinorum]|uniref:snRNA-activating protein complex subunit-like isoform X1 n=1 Tax=Salvia divinorum TaxID=28513 RepID=A0ABD1GAY7_SALDI
MLGHDEGGENFYVSIPLGGPIYVSDLVGPLTRVPDFETSVIEELESLKEEVYGDMAQVCDEDISVDELKIIQEDELVSKAFEEAFKVDELAGGSPSDSAALGIEQSCLQNPEENKKAIVSSESNNNLPGKRKNWKGVSKKNNYFDESYMVKVEQLARIKLKQEEDKACVRLHSFNNSIVPGHGVNAKAEKIKHLKSGSVSKKQVKATSSYGDVPVQFPEAVLSFEVYHNRKTGSKTQEFLVLGRQFLTEVKDKMYCLTDEIMRRAGKYDPSGYFLIEDVFCNDTRESSNVDYSKTILDWLKNSKNDALEKWEFIVAGEVRQKQKAILGTENKQQLPRFKSLHMQSTRFCDLRFHLGAGYLYCHQGNCRHLIVLRDMRLIHPEDVQKRSAYPLITYQPKLLFKKCSVCKIYKADKVTVDDKWASENPCYFCDICYYMLHYVDRSLLYSDFSVYDYHHE